jgi:DNA-binding GntR family transcriptional regulator
MTSLSAPPGWRPRAAAPVYQRLRSLIVRGRLGPGARVTESGVATDLRVSRTPVREALHHLVRDGLLMPVNGGGGGRTRLVVAPMEAATLIELYRLAGALEGLAARELALLSPADRARLARQLGTAERAFRREAAHRPVDYDRLFQRHDAVHRTLIDACAGAEVRAALDSIRPRLDRFEWYYAPLVGPDLQATYREHAAIIRAARGGTAQSIEQAVRANWFNGAVRLARALARSPGPRRGFEPARAPARGEQ